MRLWGGLDRLARGADLRGATLSAPGEGQRRNSRFTVVTATPTSTVTALLAIPGIVLLFALPAFASRALLQELFYVFTMLALAQLWNLLAGCAGLVSVGQQAFVGVGAYALFAFTVMEGFDAVPSIVLAGVVAGVVAVPAALIVFRLRGAYFAIGTWVVAEVCRLVLAQVKQLGGGTGTSLPTDVAGSILGLDQVRELFAVRGPAARDILAYWLALAARRRHFHAGLQAAALALRARAFRHRRRRGRRRERRRRRLPHQAPDLRGDRHGDRHGRRTHLPAEGAGSRPTRRSRSSIGRPMSSSSWSSAASARWKARSSAC